MRTRALEIEAERVAAINDLDTRRENISMRLISRTQEIHQNSVKANAAHQDYLRIVTAANTQAMMLADTMQNDLNVAFGASFQNAVNTRQTMGDFKNALFDTAIQEGLTATETALLAGALGLLTDAQITAALKSAAMTEKARDLGQAVADGKISIDDAVNALTEFQGKLDNQQGAEQMAHAIDRINGNIRDTSSGIRDAGGAFAEFNQSDISSVQQSMGEVVTTVQNVESALGGVGRGLDEINGKRATVYVDVVQNGNVSAGTVTTGQGQTAEFRAHGGPISAGKPYIVGEQGPELIVPQSAGMVIPNSTTNNYYNMSVNTNASGATVQRDFALLQSKSGAR